MTEKGLEKSKLDKIIKDIEKLEIELSGFSYEELDKLKDLLCKLDEFELASQVMDFVTNQFKQQLK